MTPTLAKHASAVLAAYGEGKPIEIRSRGTAWRPFRKAHNRFDFENYKFRVAATPTN